MEKFNFKFERLIEPSKQHEAAKFIFAKQISVYDVSRQQVYKGHVTFVDVAGNFGLEIDSETGSTIEFDMQDCIIEPYF